MDVASGWIFGVYFGVIISGVRNVFWSYLYGSGDILECGVSMCGVTKGSESKRKLREHGDTAFHVVESKLE